MNIEEIVAEIVRGLGFMSANGNGGKVKYTTRDGTAVTVYRVQGNLIRVDVKLPQ